MLFSGFYPQYGKRSHVERVLNKNIPTTNGGTFEHLQPELDCLQDAVVLCPGVPVCSISTAKEITTSSVRDYKNLLTEIHL